MLPEPCQQQHKGGAGPPCWRLLGECLPSQSGAAACPLLLQACQPPLPLPPSHLLFPRLVHSHANLSRLLVVRGERAQGLAAVEKLLLGELLRHGPGGRASITRWALQGWPAACSAAPQDRYRDRLH